MYKKLTCLMTFVLVFGLIAQAADPNIVGQWKFDESSGTTAYDSSYNNNHGTIYGGASLDGSGQLTLDGDDDYVSLPIGSVIASLTNSTFVAWVDFSNSGGAWQRIFDFGKGTTVNMFLTPRTGTSGPMRFAITIGGAGAEQRVTAPSTLPSGLRCVVVRIDADNDTITLFLDGSPVAENASATLTPSDLGSTTNNWLGKSQYSADAYFKGSYEEFRIYDYALSDTQIENLSYTPILIATNPKPLDGAEGVDFDADLSWTPGELVQDVNGHDVYFGTDEDAATDANRTNHANVDYYNVDDPCCDPGPLQLGQTYYWRVDEVNEPNIWEGEVWEFTTAGSQASNPNPADLASGVSIVTGLSWTPGVAAASHDVYFGTDFEDVNSASVGYHPNVDYNNVDVNSYYPGLLKPYQVYFWRIDEVNEDTIWGGDVWSFTTAAGGPLDISNDYFELTFDMEEGGFTKIQRTDDSFETNFASNPGWLLGDIETTYRIGSGSWEDASTYNSDDNRNITVIQNGQKTIINMTYPTPSGNPEGIRDFDVSQRWVLDGNNLTLDVNIVNTTGDTLELGDLAVPLPFNSDYSGLDTGTIQTKRVIRHGFFSGHASHSYWSRVNGVPAFLVMTTPSSDTRFEYWDNIENDPQFKPFVYSAISGPADAGTWRQQHTSRIMSPGETINLKFNFSWADSLNGVRNILYEDNDIDIECVPGMTIPQDLYALIKLRTKQAIDSVVAEYPADTVIQYLGESEPDTHIYKVTFNRIGENIITINHNGTEQTILEFFSTEPLETLIKKRASHLVNYQQVRNPSKWYDGLVGPWDMRYSVVRTPDDTDGFDGWWGYVIACDDPGLCHVPLLASKNVHYPVQSEIEACEYYIDNFVWGGLQRMDTESPNPWGIYGVPNWYEHRVLDPDPWATGRIYDYPHIVMLYYHMYEIAKEYPDMVSYLDKDGYLYRAYNTAIKYFDITSWVYEVGTMDELVILEVIDALREEGWYTEADALEAEWDTKVKNFIFDKEYPYGSEYAMDSTAFESSHALAKWAMENGLEPDPEHPVIDPNRIEEFMHGQMMANLAVRGCIEPAFYTYGSDYRVWGQKRYTLSYMSQMGGWAVLDYGLKWTDNPLDYIRLGYGSYLSSWALMNSDPTGSNGYWYPSALNDGAIGWAFKPEKNGPIWLQGRYLERGVWYYDGEIDLGLGGALRAAKAVVSDDPVFGLFGYGCDVTLSGGKYYVEPKDGLREWLVMQNLGLQLKLDRDAFAKGQEIAIGSTSHLISFVVENERLNAHTTKLTVSGLAAGTYVVKIDGVKQYTFSVTGSEETVLNLDIGSDVTYEISINLIADIDDSGSVDFIDFAKFALYWWENGCGDCGGADLTGDGNVDWDDLKEFAASWQQ